MDRNGNNFRATEQENGHISEDDLLLYADGELNREQSAQTQAHLEACWSCRARAEKYEETIRSYVDYRESVQKPVDEEPPGGWRKFHRKLDELIVEKGHPSTVSRLRGWLGSLRPALPDFSFHPQMVARFVAVSVIAAIVVALVLFKSNQVTTVSANELIQRAVDAQASSIRQTSQPVLHQRLQLKRKTQAKEEAVAWETWNDVTNARFAEVVNATELRKQGEATPDTETRRHGDTAKETGSRRPRVSPSPSPLPELVTDLNNVFVANKMDPKHPLSATSFKSWRDSLAQKQDDVTRTKLSSGADGLTLRTLVLGTVNDGAIKEATFTVRASDWHPVTQTLEVKVAGGVATFTLSEADSEVLSLAQIDPKIFAGQPIATTPGSAAKPETPGPETPNAKPETAAAVASADLEIEILRLLHQAGADLGEQISVKRTAGGPVRVTGIVETDRRKAEIVDALNPVAANPAVQIDIQTVAEAIAKQKSANSQNVTTSEGVEIQNTGIVAEPELRAYFEGRSSNTDAAVRQFAAGMVGQSCRAMQHLGAMRRLVNQFSPQQLRNLTPEPRASWLSLLRSHARAFQQQSAAMRRELKPVFFPGASEDLPGAATIHSDEELKRAVQELFAAGAANDQVIRSAFTVTNQGARFTAIGTPQFWQAIKKAETLAAGISRP
jgi:hypothetical protein